MCQLLGVSSNKHVDIQLSIQEFKCRGKTNPHGWGFAFFQDNKWQVIKKPDKLSEEDVTDSRFHFKSNIIIGHVRLASCGNHIHKNTHPFNIQSWAFAHNGDVQAIMGMNEFSISKYHPLGGTDSEYAFCFLLEKIEEEPQNIVKILKSESAKIRQKGRFNYLLSDGTTLYAYGHDSLYMVKRSAPFQTVTLKDDNYTCDLNEIKAPDEKAVLIATEPLTKEEEWVEIKGLKVFRNGEEIPC